jgi:hypothetical protein
MQYLYEQDSCELTFCWHVRTQGTSYVNCNSQLRATALRKQEVNLYFVYIAATVFKTVIYSRLDSFMRAFAVKKTLV